MLSAWRVWEKNANTPYQQYRLLLLLTKTNYAPAITFYLNFFHMKYQLSFQALSARFANASNPSLSTLIVCHSDIAVAPILS